MPELLNDGLIPILIFFVTGYFRIRGRLYNRFGDNCVLCNSIVSRVKSVQINDGIPII